MYMLTQKYISNLIQVDFLKPFLRVFFSPLEERSQKCLHGSFNKKMNRAFSTTLVSVTWQCTTEVQAASIKQWLKYDCIDFGKGLSKYAEVEVDFLDFLSIFFAFVERIAEEVTG